MEAQIKQIKVCLWRRIQSSGLIKVFTHYSLADLFNQTSSQFIWEAFSHVASNTQKLLVLKFPFT